MGKKDRQSMEELWSKRFDEEAEFNEEEPLSRKAKREREKSISPILTVTLIFMALLIILPTSAYLWWSSRDGLSEEPTSPSVEQVAENSQDEETEEAELEDPEESDNEETDTRVSEEEESQDEVEDVTETDEGSSEESNETVTESAGSSPSETGSDESGSEEVIDSSQEETSSSETADTESSVESEPASDPASAENVDYYTVKAGDNMYRIALNHGMSTEELMQLNGISDENVYVGQELRVN